MYNKPDRESPARKKKNKEERLGENLSQQTYMEKKERRSWGNSSVEGVGGGGVECRKENVNPEEEEND